nr:Vesicle transport protein [Ipomoea batatas]
MLHNWLYIDHQRILCSKRSKKSAFAHVIKGEASFHSLFYWQHGRDNLCFHGVAQLYPLCALLSVAGTLTVILCHLLLPWRVIRNEIPFFHPYVLNSQMFWKVTDVHF